MNNLHLAQVTELEIQLFFYWKQNLLSTVFVKLLRIIFESLFSLVISDIGTNIKLPSVLLWDSWSNLNVTYNKANLDSHPTVYSQIKTVWKNYFSIIKRKQKKNNEQYILFTALS